MLSRLSSALKDFSGNTTIMFALSAVVLFGAAGAAIDFSRTIAVKAALQSSIDIATLATAQATMQSSSGGLSKANADFGKKFGEKFKIDYGAKMPTFSFKQKGTELTGTAKTEFPLSFTSLLTGHKTQPVSATAVVNLASSGYSNFTFLLDVSESMNIGSTPAEISKMNDQIGCAFACHFEPNPFTGKTLNDYARDIGAELRVDVMRRGVNNLVDVLFDKRDKTVRMSVYQGSDSLVKVIENSKNNGKVKDAVNNLATISQFTFISDHLVTVAKEIGASGTGDSESSPKKYVVLATDGAMGARENKSPLSLNGCNILKSNGVTVAVVYIQQYDTSPDPTYDLWVKPNLPDIEANLTACASSSSLFMKVQSAQEILDGFKDLEKNLQGDLQLSLAR